MKKNTSYSYVGISFIVLVFGIWVVPKIISHFSNKKDDLVIVGKAPEFRFTNQDNKSISNADYIGKVYIVEFFFTSCPGICITMNNNMKKLQKVFFGNPKFGIASISIDPDRDTPEKLKSYSQKYGANNSQWHFLTGKKDDIYNLSNRGFNVYASVNPDVEGGFEHSGLFALIDQQGNIRSRKDRYGNPIIYYDGTSDEGIRQIEEDIENLLK